MKRHAGLMVLAVSLLFLGLACAPSFNLTLGEIPSADPMTNIKPGETTRGEVQGLFGSPDLEGVNDDGQFTWTYTRMSVKVEKASDARMTDFFSLVVAFDGDLVSSFSFDRKAKE
jgi:hypothetical protein